MLASSLLPLFLPALAPRPAQPSLHCHLPQFALATAVWVSADERTPVTTVTPHETTVDSTPTLADAAPNEVTGTVFTLTENVVISTSTGSRVPAPTNPASKNPAGAFARCFKEDDDEFAPFCDPSAESEVHVDRTYYITWNPDFFNDTLTKLNNTAEWRIRIRADRVDATNGSIGAKAFETDDSYPASWGVYPWRITSSVLESKQPTNVSLLILAHRQGQAETVEHRGPTVFVTYPPAFRTESPRLPKGAELYIALPSVAGFILVVVFGTCLWNKKSRKIDIGNIMSRSRHGYGVGKARARRLAGHVRKSMRRKEERGVMLDEWELNEGHLSPGERYRDMPAPGRRDSDALGSLAGTPVNDRFPRSPAPDSEGRNVFREEMERQNRERGDAPNYL
ncbi:hypothetical protein jhhlp_004520 [Lomentospora prolificans]|uniref:Uncharacterized protein n=1 Tax=Lomentospora prolificans TaxID=41688 RepID=A0A2N3NBX5_9PEZI|nr:hypothetical protein jhhlp_004520 [Lomentospora prolificans]